VQRFAIQSRVLIFCPWYFQTPQFPDLILPFVFWITECWNEHWTRFNRLFTFLNWRSLWLIYIYWVMFTVLLILALASNILT
jgi:hypothetical protein